MVTTTHTIDGFTGEAEMWNGEYRAKFYNSRTEYRNGLAIRREFNYFGRETLNTRIYNILTKNPTMSDEAKFDWVMEDVKALLAIERAEAKEKNDG